MKEKNSLCISPTIFPHLMKSKINDKHSLSTSTLMKSHEKIIFNFKITHENSGLTFVSVDPVLNGFLKTFKSIPFQNEENYLKREETIDENNASASKISHHNLISHKQSSSNINGEK